MGKRWGAYKFAGIWLLVTVFLGSPALVPAAGTEEKPAKKKDDEKKGSTRIKDAPEPIPKVMDKLKEIGNTVGEGITKAASEGARAVNKAVEGDKKKDKDKK